MKLATVEEKHENAVEELHQVVTEAEEVKQRCAIFGF